jgi:hypothetical protein
MNKKIIKNNHTKKMSNKIKKFIMKIIKSKFPIKKIKKNKKNKTVFYLFFFFLSFDLLGYFVSK